MWKPHSATYMKNEDDAIRDLLALITDICSMLEDYAALCDSGVTSQHQCEDVEARIDEIGAWKTRWLKR